MKKILYAALALVMAAACTPEQEWQPDTNLYASGTVNLCASIEEIMTKMVMDATGRGMWSAGDKIAVACSDGSFVEFELNGTGDTKRAIFTGEIPEGKTLGKVAVWPATAVAGLEGDKLTLKVPSEYSLDNIAFDGIMVANITDSWEITFRHVMARPKFVLKNYPSAAAYLTIEADGKALGGRLVLDVNSENGIEAYNGTQGLKIETPGAGTTVSFTVNMPVYGYEEVKVKLFNEEDRLLLEQVVNELKFDVYRGATSTLTASLEALPEIYDPVDVDYIEVCGIKWAKGNLQAKQGVSQKGMQDGWRIAPYQWHGFCYDMTSSSLGNYTYNPEKATEMRYENNNTQFEHFNLGGLARNARFYSDGNWLMPENSSDFNISGKIYTDVNGSAVLEAGQGRWANPGTFTSNNSEIWGDLAYWASRGAYRTPTHAEMDKLLTDAYIQVGWVETKDFGDEKDFKVWGILFTNPTADQTPGYDARVKEERKFSVEELNSGLFLPKSGRRNNATSNTVIQCRVQGTYRTTDFVGDGNCTSGAAGQHRWYAYAMHFNGNSIAWQATVGSAYDTAAGFLIRPIVNDAYDPDNI